MQRNLVQIIWLLMLAGFVSMAYYLSLVAGVPFFAGVAAGGALGFFSYKWMDKNIVVDTPDIGPRHSLWSYSILITGVMAVTYKTWQLETKFGSWDAWVIWNYHARFLQHRDTWRSLFTIDPKYHADYPLYVSGTIAFLRRLTSTDGAVVPFAFGYCVTLLVPVAVFLSLHRKNLPIASLAFLLLVTDGFYLSHGLWQYADVPLSLLFLCSMICLEYIEGRPAIVAINAALLGCCMWTKNEGVMLSAIFVAFNLKVLFGAGRWKYFVAVIAIPLLTLALFKLSAPATDIVAGQNGQTVHFLLDRSRYVITWRHFKDNVNLNFPAIKKGLIVYAIICIFGRKWPSKNLLLLLCCTVCYCMVYVTTPKDIEWHINTSMDRVLLHLMPSFMYVLALRFSNLKFSLASKQVQ